DELALAIDLQGAVAGVALALRRLHRQEGVAVDGHVERAAGLLDRALAEVVPGGAVEHEAQAAVGAGEAIRAGHRHEVFLEDVAVRLEPGGVQVGHIVGDDIELPLQRHLPRKADQETVLHRSCSPLPAKTPRFPARGPRSDHKALPSPWSWGALQM